MDDSCAVCAEPLEWVAYGSCGHRDVCSTCVARLRFICADRRCCICKTESDVVVVTKALGDYTRMINDFSILPLEAREGQVGSYWYHEDTQGFFDDVDHYKIIKAMCRLSCSVCDKMEEPPHDISKRRGAFRNIKQLKDHLYHWHRLYMCNLCLGGRKVFICEQKLYTKAQLVQHKSTGDSDVDGNESERGGFMGHPMCEFCRSSFYGDNELYTHMSTEHYTCHICQRQHPGQYEYYKDYDDLEIHFRQEHFLCEDEGCLAKKFIVFQSEAELKRHNTMEHGGRMSRSKRNAALQIPTSFRYRRSNEQDSRRGRGRTFHRDFSEDQLSMAIQASLETANVDSTFHDQSSTRSGQVAIHSEHDEIDPIIQPFESLATADSEAPSRYLQALGHNSRQSSLVEASFPPLSTATGNNQQQSNLSGFPSNTMAAHLRRKSKKNVSNVSSIQGRPAAGWGPSTGSSNPMQSTHVTNLVPEIPRGSDQIKAATSVAYALPTYASTTQAWVKTATASISASSSKSSSDSSRISHSVSAPNLVSSVSTEPSISDFPPVSAAHVSKMPVTKQSGANVEDIHAANKSLVEKIHAALEFNQDNYAAFKDISALYRQGQIGTSKYLDFVQEFGLSHLVFDLARLCPDPEKQRELLESYNTRIEKNSLQDNGQLPDIASTRDVNVSRKGEGKLLDNEESNSRDILANRILSTVKELQSSYKPSEEEVEVLSKKGYRAVKGKMKVIEDEQQNVLTNSGDQALKLDGQDNSSMGSKNNENSHEVGGSKQRKKASKFLRARLGDGSAAALLDVRNSYGSDMNSAERKPQVEQDNPGGLPVRGVWRNGGGHKLFS